MEESCRNVEPKMGRLFCVIVVFGSVDGYMSIPQCPQQPSDGPQQKTAVTTVSQPDIPWPNKCARLSAYDSGVPQAVPSLVPVDTQAYGQRVPDGKTRSSPWNSLLTRWPSR